jgi:hypothetical protein
LHSLEQLVIVLSFRSPSDASLLPCACQPCLYTLADSDPLLLRNGVKDADDGLTEDASRVQILFCEATSVNSIPRQPLQMVQCFDRSLTAQAIQTLPCSILWQRQTFLITWHLLLTSNGVIANLFGPCRGMVSSN